VKALSLRQPWANAVLYLGKHIENRRWSTKFRGDFLIHAAKGMTKAELSSALEFCEDVLGNSRCFDVIRELSRVSLKFGGIVGRARLVDVIAPRPEFVLTGVESHYPPSVTRTPDLWRWHMREQYGFVLADVAPLPFIPCKGELGFFDVPAQVMAEVA
jgi:hypothetical protein